MHVSEITNRLENPCRVIEKDVNILRTANSEAIHRDLDNVYQWSVRWDLPLIMMKC